MEWTVSTAQSLAEIDREISLKDPANFSPAEYEIVRRAVLATADLDYWHLLRFSAQAMEAGAAALVARTPVVVDGAMLQAGLNAVLENTFGNPIYCSLEIPTRSRNGESQAAWGMRAFAERYPQGLFVVGQEPSVLTVLMELVEAEKIAPALVIGAPAGIVAADVAKQRLNDSMVPHIRVDGRKGNAVVAVAIFEGLVDLAWLAYGDHSPQTW